MHTPGRIFLAGVFVALLMFKPGFAGALLQSFGSVIQAAFASDTVPRPAPTPIEQPKQEVVIEEIDPTRMLEERDQKFLSLFDKIMERLDRLEAKPAPEPEVDPKVRSYREALEQQEALERARGYSGDDPMVRERYGLPPKLPPFDEYNTSEMSVDQFDQTFNRRFSVPLARAH